jgi:hypothetical protein
MYASKLHTGRQRSKSCCPKMDRYPRSPRLLANVAVCWYLVECERRLVISAITGRFPPRPVLTKIVDSQTFNAVAFGNQCIDKARSNLKKSQSKRYVCMHSTSVQENGGISERDADTSELSATSAKAKTTARLRGVYDWIWDRR